MMLVYSFGRCGKAKTTYVRKLVSPRTILFIKLFSITLLLKFSYMWKIIHVISDLRYPFDHYSLAHFVLRALAVNVVNDISRIRSTEIAQTLIALSRKEIKRFARPPCHLESISPPNYEGAYTRIYRPATFRGLDDRAPTSHCFSAFSTSPP